MKTISVYKLEFWLALPIDETRIKSFKTQKYTGILNILDPQNASPCDNMILNNYVTQDLVNGNNLDSVYALSFILLLSSLV